MHPLRAVLPLVWSVLLAAPQVCLHAQPAEGGARSVALAGATSALGGDVWAHANAAAPATLDGRALSFFASEGYGLAELRLGAVRYVEPTPFAALALGAQTFGFDDFRATRFDVGLARGFAMGSLRHFFAGIALHYDRVRIPGYGSAGTFGIDTGGIVSVYRSLSFGYQATSVNAPRLSGEDESRRSLAFGLCYAPAAPFLLAMDVYKDVRFPLSVRTGLEVTPLPALALRAGVATQPTRFSAGAGLRAGKLVADVAAQRHEALGWTPALSFGLQW